MSMNAGMSARALALLLAGAGAVYAQSLRFYSEFQRIGLDGKVVSADRQERSREILSPAVARNAFASFHVVLTGPPGTPYSLHFSQNPDHAVRPAFYREIHDSDGMPDRLEKIDLPLEGKIDENGRALVLWMDLWVEAAAPVRRIRVEAQAWMLERWIIAPMEVRIMPAIAADPVDTAAMLATATSPADTFAFGPLREYLCEAREAPGKADPSIRQLIQRNARQDATLARAAERTHGRADVLARLAGAMGVPSASNWCEENPPSRPPGQNGPEWVLRLRDLLVRGW
jgi:hypothetical protein